MQKLDVNGILFWITVEKIVVECKKPGNSSPQTAIPRCSIIPYLQQAKTQALHIFPRSVSSAFPLCVPQAPVSSFPCTAATVSALVFFL